MCSNPLTAALQARSSTSFQSLSRDSVCSNCLRTQSARAIHHCFNPSVGILCAQTLLEWSDTDGHLVFQSLSRDSVCSNTVEEKGWTGFHQVSIPQSGFCVLKHCCLRCSAYGGDGFNPSVGILCAQTPNTPSPCPRFVIVSIPQSGFCVLKRTPHAPGPTRCTVSIPQSGFCVLKRRPRTALDARHGSFNPSVGILCAQTLFVEYGYLECRGVSIPQSGFCVLKRAGFAWDIGWRRVSIPQSGFCVLKQPSCAHT